ncbi:Wadjet anti-phage system protein JetD domain-containing protein [Aquimonas sp.]|uniref:Wadjet anti-phage system protein JetD domain-containing protein n=1 Tax=Aquimonas sp. TaxID=1872588 RepID=UPI0037C097D4
MKSPTELALRLARQWQMPAVRESRLFEPEQWPLRLPIGAPAPSQLLGNIDAIRAHVQAWRQVQAGTIEWQPRAFRAAGAPIELPRYWRLDSPSEWIAACADATVQSEFARLERLMPQLALGQRRLLVRQLHLLRERSDADVLAAARFAEAAEPGCAQGLPLRAIALAGVDSKLLERCRALVLALLDARFDGAASAQGLENFLGASGSSEHWLLVLPLAPGLLPFERLRLRTSELAARGLPGTHLLVVENERCAHALPELADTVAVLGAGLDLDWLGAEVWRGKHVAYWGDLDSWGLRMLAQARRQQPGLCAVLMERELFDSFALQHAVVEPIPADPEPPAALSASEQALYRHLLEQERGRLEQEFVPPARVQAALRAWREASPAR